jgi:hypothetical protein
LEAVRGGAADGLDDRVKGEVERREDVDEPVVDPAVDGVDGGVRAVDGDVVLG